MASWSPLDSVNPEELGSYAEGDIVMPKIASARNGLKAESSHWKGGVVPYRISDDFSKSTVRNFIQSHYCPKYRRGDC